MRESTIFYSFRVQEELLNINEPFVWGKAHYSYKVLKNRCIDLLKSKHIKVREIIRPEIYKHEIAFKFLEEFQLGDVHLIFKPFEEIRILKGAYNIGIIAWEFDQISTAAINSFPFSNHLRILSMLDEVWVLCEYTKKVLQQYNLKNVYCIPAPVRNIYVKKRTSIENLLASTPAVPLNTINLAQPNTFINVYNTIRPITKIYLSVINPWDRRKNIEELITSFAKFSRKYKQALLIVKLVIDNQGTRLFNINEILAEKFKLKSSNIIFISEDLTEEQVNALMQSVDYYYCMSKAEGQNLPLIEAMSVGTVPVSVMHTAMADYIQENNAFIIKSNLELTSVDSNASKNSNLHWYKPEFKSAINALKASCQANSLEYNTKSDNCIKLVEYIYSDRAVFDKIIQRINLIANE